MSRNGSNVTKNTAQHHLLRPAYISTIGPEPQQNTSEKAATTSNHMDSLLGSSEETKITAADPDIAQEIIEN